ncbi:AraC family transcriptional regulator [Paenibacillus roseipurpureus]|uniref:AraC family transcriptional regulator n=1 Tax=Paenibacillus roseopurpureus TaxID=2918901 RepID=A0AA96LPU2_9BACL|nr:AraC family transcriptional regulator [Paenibacillus sp. MBLB1832]WNR45750.1 AraC family transcriptional regulator [Paenibacillus sp. MBLB1832]
MKPGNELDRVRKRLFNRRSFLHRMIYSSLIATVIATLAVGLGSYWYSASVLQKEISRANSNVLQSSAQAIDQKLQSIQNAALQMLSVYPYSNNLDDNLSQNDASLTYSLSASLNAFKNNNRDVADVSLYIRNRFLLSGAYGGYRTESLIDRHLFEDRLHAGKGLQWVFGQYRMTPNAQYSGISLMISIPLSVSDPIGMLIVNVNSQLFADTLARSRLYKDEVLAIMDAGRNVVATTSNRLSAEQLKSIDELAPHPEGNYYTDPYNGIRYLVSSTKSPLYNWSYIDLIPVSELNAKSHGIANVTILISIVFILIGLVSVVLQARKAYRPIRSLLHSIKDGQTAGDTEELADVERRWLDMKKQTETYMEQLHGQLPILQETFSLQLIQGLYLHYSKDELDNQLRKYQIPVQARHQLFLLTYDLPLMETNRYKESDRDLIIFAIRNIVHEMMHSYSISGIIVNLLNQHIAIWLWDHSERMESDGRMGFVEETRRIVANLLKLQVTATVTGVTEQVSALHEMFLSAQATLRSRIVIGANQTIQDKGIWQDVHPTSYPLDLELQYESALRQGDLEKAEHALEQFSIRLQSSQVGFERVRILYTQLLASTLRVAYSSGYQVLDDWKMTDPYSEMNKLQKFEDVNRWIVQHFARPITTYILNVRDRQYVDAIQQVVEFIHKNYQHDISLEQCAELCGLSTQYLSKLFKNTMETSFIDYLTDVRINRAKQLLRETDLSVQEIAAQIGYLPQNFFRVFKKWEQMTPGQYREDYLKNVE